MPIYRLTNGRYSQSKQPGAKKIDITDKVVKDIISRWPTAYRIVRNSFSKFDKKVTISRFADRFYKKYPDKYDKSYDIVISKLTGEDQEFFYVEPAFDTVVGTKELSQAERTYMASRFAEEE